MRPCGTSLFQAGGAHVQKLKLKLGSAVDDHGVSPFRRYNEAMSMRMHIDIEIYCVVRVADLRFITISISILLYYNYYVMIVK